MSVELNHTIVHARDNRESAEFLAHILGLEVGAEWGPFVPVDTSNGVTLDSPRSRRSRSSCSTTPSSSPRRSSTRPCARIKEAGITYYADPHGKQPGEINHYSGGRGLYFMDPSGHAMEIITRPYGSPEPAES